jgi:hypothetical protein
MGRACRRHGENRNAYKILVEPLGSPRRKWVNNIKMGLREIGWGGVAWRGVAWRGVD